MRCFPEERLLFGSDWPPSCGGDASVGAIASASHQLIIDEFGAAFARKLFCENAKRVYSLA